MPQILYIPVVLTNINPLTKFQVATLIGTLKAFSYKKHNLVNLAQVRIQWTVTYGSSNPDFRIFLLNLDLHPHTKFQVATTIETLKCTSYNNLTSQIWPVRSQWTVKYGSSNPESCIFLLNLKIDIHPHTKFQVATITGSLKSTSYKNLNLSLIGT